MLARSFLLYAPNTTDAFTLGVDDGDFLFVTKDKAREKLASGELLQLDKSAGGLVSGDVVSETAVAFTYVPRQPNKVAGVLVGNAPPVFGSKYSFFNHFLCVAHFQHTPFFVTSS